MRREKAPFRVPFSGCPLDDNLAVIFDRMTTEDINQFPVMANGRLFGMVARSNVLSFAREPNRASDRSFTGPEVAKMALAWYTGNMSDPVRTPGEVQPRLSHSLNMRFEPSWTHPIQELLREQSQR